MFIFLAQELFYYYFCDILHQLNTFHYEKTLYSFDGHIRLLNLFYGGGTVRSDARILLARLSAFFSSS